MISTQAAESRGWTDVACVTARVVRHAFRRCRELLPAIERADWAAPYDPDAYTRYGTRTWRPDDDEPVDVPDDGASDGGSYAASDGSSSDDDDDEDDEDEEEEEDGAAEDDAEMGFEEAPLAVGSRVDAHGPPGRCSQEPRWRSGCTSRSCPASRWPTRTAPSQSASASAASATSPRSSPAGAQLQFCAQSGGQGPRLPLRRLG